MQRKTSQSGSTLLCKNFFSLSFLSFIFFFQNEEKKKRGKKKRGGGNENTINKATEE